MRRARAIGVLVKRNEPAKARRAKMKAEEKERWEKQIVVRASAIA